METQTKSLSVEEVLYSLKQVLQKSMVEYEKTFDIADVGEVTIHLSPGKTKGNVSDEEKKQFREGLKAVQKKLKTSKFKYVDPTEPAVPLSVYCDWNER